MAVTFGSLFAGIGGFDLGFERSGMECRWQVEIEPYCQKVLAKHWPNVTRWDDVKTFPPEQGEWDVDVICGGFPCQDISTANPNRVGISGERSGLWSEFFRIICLLRPRIAVIENVSAISLSGLDQVLCDLASIGFDAEWKTLPASAFGAPQPRGRTFIVANTMRQRREVILCGEPRTFGKEAPWGEWQTCSLNTRCDVLQAVEKSTGEPAVYGSSDGIPNIVDRLRGLGNSVVPQVSQWIGERIMEALGEMD